MVNMKKLRNLLIWKCKQKKVGSQLPTATRMAGVEEVEPVPSILLPCTICTRTFRPEALAKHAKVCEKTLMRKRKQFDSAKQRLQGTEVENFATPPPKVRSPKKRDSIPGNVVGGGKAKWKEKQTAELVRTVQSVKRLGEQGLPSQVKPSDHEECPYCGRSFGPKSYERHAEFCKEQHQKLRMMHTSNNEARERLKVRTTYRGPLTNKVLNRDRYQPTKNRDPSPRPQLDRILDDSNKSKSLTRNSSLRSSLRSTSMVKEPPPLRRTMTQINPPKNSAALKDNLFETEDSPRNQFPQTKPRIIPRDNAEKRMKPLRPTIMPAFPKSRIPIKLNETAVNTITELSVSSCPIHEGSPVPGSRCGSRGSSQGQAVTRKKSKSAIGQVNIPNCKRTKDVIIGETAEEKPSVAEASTSEDKTLPLKKSQAFFIDLKLDVEQKKTDKKPTMDIIEEIPRVEPKVLDSEISLEENCMNVLLLRNNKILASSDHGSKHILNNSIDGIVVNDVSSMETNRNTEAVISNLPSLDSLSTIESVPSEASSGKEKPTAIASFEKTMSSGNRRSCTNLYKAKKSICLNWRDRVLEMMDKNDDISEMPSCESKLSNESVDKTEEDSVMEVTVLQNGKEDGSSVEPSLAGSGDEALASRSGGNANSEHLDSVASCSELADLNCFQVGNSASFIEFTNNKSQNNIEICTEEPAENYSLQNFQESIHYQNRESQNIIVEDFMDDQPTQYFAFENDRENIARQSIESQNKADCCADELPRRYEETIQNNDIESKSNVEGFVDGSVQKFSSENDYIPVDHQGLQSQRKEECFVVVSNENMTVEHSMDEENTTAVFVDILQNQKGFVEQPQSDDFISSNDESENSKNLREQKLCRDIDPDSLDSRTVAEEELIKHDDYESYCGINHDDNISEIQKSIASSIFKKSFSDSQVVCGSSSREELGSLEAVGPEDGEEDVELLHQHIMTEYGPLELICRKDCPLPLSFIDPLPDGTFRVGLGNCFGDTRRNDAGYHPPSYQEQGMYDSGDDRTQILPGNPYSPEKETCNSIEYGDEDPQEEEMTEGEDVKTTMSNEGYSLENRNWKDKILEIAGQQFVSMNARYYPEMNKDCTKSHLAKTDLNEDDMCDYCGHHFSDGNSPCSASPRSMYVLKDIAHSPKPTQPNARLPPKKRHTLLTRRATKKEEDNLDSKRKLTTWASIAQSSPKRESTDSNSSWSAEMDSLNVEQNMNYRVSQYSDDEISRSYYTFPHHKPRGNWRTNKKNYREVASPRGDGRCFYGYESGHMRRNRSTHRRKEKKYLGNPRRHHERETSGSCYSDYSHCKENYCTCNGRLRNRDEYLSRFEGQEYCDKGYSEYTSLPHLQTHDPPPNCQGHVDRYYVFTNREGVSSDHSASTYRSDETNSEYGKTFHHNKKSSVVVKSSTKTVHHEYFEQVEYRKKHDEFQTIKTSIYQLPGPKTNMARTSEKIFKLPEIMKQQNISKFKKIDSSRMEEKSTQCHKLPPLEKIKLLPYWMFPHIVRHVIATVLPKRFAVKDAEKYDPFVSAEQQMLELLGVGEWPTGDESGGQQESPGTPTVPPTVGPAPAHNSPQPPSIHTSPTSAFVKYSSPKRSLSIESVIHSENKENNNNVHNETVDNRSPVVGDKIDNNRKQFSLSNLSLCSVISLDSIDCNKNPLGFNKGSRYHLDEFQRSFSAIDNKSGRVSGKNKINMQEMLYGNETGPKDMVSGGSESSNSSDVGNLETCEAELLVSMLEFEKMLNSSPLPSPDPSPNLCSSTDQRRPDPPKEVRGDSEHIQQPHNHTIDSAYSSLSRPTGNEGEGGHAEMSRFCHECGARYPVPKAKFCCNCGIRRLTL